MGYIGNQQAEGFVQRPTKQDLTGATGDTLTLTHAVSKEEDIDLYINNVKQEPTTAYTVADTVVTLTGDVVASDDIYVVYNSLALQTVVPPDGSVTSAKLASGAVTSAKLDTNIAVTGTLTTSGTLDVNSTLDVSSSNFKMTDLNSNAFYRTGTWTPILSDQSATDTNATIHTGTPAVQLGWYQRVGNVVNVQWHYQTPASSFSYTNGSSGTGQLSFSGLPFTVANLTGYYPIANCGYFAALNGWDGSGYGYPFQGIGVYNTKQVHCNYPYATSVTIVSSSAHSTTNSQSIWSMTYLTDDA
jgi:hypothetical protein